MGTPYYRYQAKKWIYTDYATKDMHTWFAWSDETKKPAT